MLYFHRTPELLKWLYPDHIWQMERNSDRVYLTFDDGPVPEMTPAILDILHEKSVKATFFCVGDNVKKYPDILDRMLQEGHHVGNHSFHHLNGWATPRETYLADVDACTTVFRERGVQTTLFRPPYGKVKRSQAREILQQNKIIMWDVLSGDFDPALSPVKCLSKTLSAVRPGSIIVLHDNPKAAERTFYVLPRLIDHLLESGLKCSVIPY
ncbi:polysaccharide deacetylase family protein [Fulvivirga sedimenti]|uniref:Polysaccharide deacetylase family protein n=1 Tax=Fulvivirga sedimenti TaxID=2879465 RepID=A0A9X1HQQ6_9BACT|nr:polysaccharide deacetylase family protein [Fulvivirga sedimenti]MCA6075218.1 polysaccharide deacetylase family protein [Fulvivirga sedimenti]MCA6076395.1 polysaccharide deacetylase family protein [Fulvivirga sedimenti]MCA6077523.1 polysaccharide deacetylase family protein [Fulvivirga sedimenti]